MAISTSLKLKGMIRMMKWNEWLQASYSVVGGELTEEATRLLILANGQEATDVEVNTTIEEIYYEYTEACRAYATKHKLDNWIIEGTAVKGWYTCILTGKKFRGTDAIKQFEDQDKLIQIIEDVATEIEIEQEQEVFGGELSISVSQASVDTSEEQEEYAVEDMPAKTSPQVLTADQMDKMSESLMQYVMLHGNTDRPIDLVSVYCEDCQTERIVKPQDVFQVKRCPECQKAHRNAKRSERRRGKKSDEKVITPSK